MYLSDEECFNVYYGRAAPFPIPVRSSYIYGSTALVTGGVCGGVILLGSVLCCVCRYIVKYFNKIITKLLQLC